MCARGDFSSLSVLSPSTPATGYQAPPPILLTEGWDGWDGWDGMVGPLFFFGPYLENYFIIFLNFFSSLKYMFLQLFLEYSRKKIGMFFFSKYFAKINNHLFLENFYKDFSNFSKTTQYIFLIVFGPLRRVIKTSFEKKNQKKIEFYFCQKISQVFFSMKFGRFLKGFLL